MLSARLNNGMAPSPTTRLATALAYMTSNRASDLLSRMNRCGSGEWNYQFTCRTPGCDVCRGRYIGKQSREATKRYGDLMNDDMAFVSVVIGATTSVDEVADIFSKFRKDLRNLVDANRRSRPRWRDIDAMLWLETDALSGADYVHLGSDKQKQLGELAPLFVMRDGPVWVVTAHGVVSHAGIDRQEVLAELDRRWPGHKRTDLRAFDRANKLQTNLRRTINYSLKHECRSHLGLVTEPWPDKWIAEYYSFLSNWSRGYQSTRITINRNKNKLLMNKPNVKLMIHEEAEPMPFIYSDSIFNTYYN